MESEEGLGTEGPAKRAGTSEEETEDGSGPPPLQPLE